MKHAELVSLATHWLKMVKRCHVVMVESNAGGEGETPDAIGWLATGTSLVVECKATKEDLRRDKQKGHHKRGLRMGDRRYYLTPQGLLQAKDCPEDHGLLWPASGRQKVQVLREAPQLDSYAGAEVRLLVAEMRRLLLGVRRPFDACGVAPAQKLYLERNAWCTSGWGRACASCATPRT